jgi:hypothetical protein
MFWQELRSYVGRTEDTRTPPRMNWAVWCGLWLVIGVGVLFSRMLATAADNAGINGPDANVVRLGQATIKIQSLGATPDVGLLGVRDWALRSASIGMPPGERLRACLLTTQLDNLRSSRTIV